MDFGNIRDLTTLLKNSVGLTIILLLYINLVKWLNKILNYKDVVYFIDADVSLSINSYGCDCADYFFCDHRHKKLITEDSKIIKYTKKGKIIIKGPDYGKPEQWRFVRHYLKLLLPLTNVSKPWYLKLRLPPQ